MHSLPARRIPSGRKAAFCSELLGKHQYRSTLGFVIESASVAFGLSFKLSKIQVT
jgi:hypothetical protein